MQPTCDSRLWLKSSEPAIPPTKRYVKPPQSWPSSHPRWLYLIHIFVLIPSARSPLKPPDPMNGLVFAYPNLKSPRGRGEARRGEAESGDRTKVNPPTPFPGGRAYHTNLHAWPCVWSLGLWIDVQLISNQFYWRNVGISAFWDRRGYTCKSTGWAPREGLGNCPDETTNHRWTA